jgi:hypothetical protein
VNKGGVAFPPHRLRHGQRRERVDECRRPVGRVRPFRQLQALRCPDVPVLREHAPAGGRDGAAGQRLSSRRDPGCDHGAGPLIADRQRLAQSARRRLEGRTGDLSRDDGLLRRPGGAGRAQIGARQKQAEVGWIDRRGFDLD